MQFQLLDWEDPLEERHGNPLSLDWIYGYNKNYISEFPHLMTEKWYLSVVLIQISLIMSNDEHLIFYASTSISGLLPGGSDGKESACNAGDWGSIPGLGRSPGDGIGKPLQYSCLENPVDRGTLQATIHGVARS